VWTTEDIGKFLYHGNETVNKNLLPAFPVWTYQPTPNDSISLKEQWISQKYKTRTDEENEKLKQPPKHAGNEIHPIQVNASHPTQPVMSSLVLPTIQERQRAMRCDPA
jgi:hypothetical protein